MAKTENERLYTIKFGIKFERSVKVNAIEIQNSVKPDGPHLEASIPTD